MADKSDTWMPLYIGDYLSATTRLTAEQHGVYLLLLMDYWRNGPPPADNTVLAQIGRVSAASWRKMKPTILGFFEERGGLLIQRRADREIERAADITEKRSAAGKASAEARANKAGNKPPANVSTHVGANGQQNGGPSQSHTPLEHKGSNGLMPDADQVFWTNAKDFIAGEAKGDPGAVIGKWSKDYGREATAQAITRAQLERPVQRIPFIVGCLKHAKQEGGLSVPC